MMKQFNWKIAQLPGLSPEYQAILENYGIKTTQDLLARTESLQQQQLLANQLQLPVRYIRKWVAMASLAQLPSVGCRYCGLLLHCGIISISQLAITPLPKLHRQVQKLYVVTQQKREECPSGGMIQKWQKEAYALQHSRPLR